MLNRISLATIFAVLLGMFAAAGASAADPDRPATPPPTDFWQNKGFMNMAHQGGELEAPGNTLYAFKTAVADRGADTLEMDGYVTADGVFVVTHDMKPSGTSNAPNDNDHEIRDLTLEQLREYDFGYKFTPGKGHYGYTGTDEYPFRGIATGDEAPPEGYTAKDFQIATFEEVLAAFPDTPLNIDMKSYSPDPSVTLAAADALAAIMNAHPERSDDVIVASFSQDAMERFHELAPTHKALSGSLDATLSYVSGNPLTPTPVAVQPPDTYNLGAPIGTVRTVPLLKPLADYDGFAVHVWGDDPQPDASSFYAQLIEEGADGYFTQQPGVLHEYLCENGIARPDGSPRCATQICPEGQEGIAPDNCTLIPPVTCPEGQVGTPPNCGTDVVDPIASVKRIVISPKKGKIKAGKKIKLKIKLTAANDGLSSGVKVNLKSSNRKLKLPKSIRMSLNAGSTTTKTVFVKAKKSAKGKAKITAKAGGKKATAKLKIKRA
ncbi:MAG: glycerophosphodiester phosphodiesterase family protein, partial [Solirubrobacterales bacterium]